MDTEIVHPQNTIMSLIVIANDQKVGISYAIQEAPGGLLGPFIIAPGKQQGYTPGKGVKTFTVISGGIKQEGVVGKTKQILLAKPEEVKRAGGKRAKLPDPVCVACQPFPVSSALPSLGDAYTFGLIGDSITASVASSVSPTVAGQPANAGLTALVGGLAVAPPGAVFPLSPGSLASFGRADAAALAAAALTLPCTDPTPLGTGILDGLTLGPGVYCTAALTGFVLAPLATLTLDAGGDPNAQFIFIDPDGTFITLNGTVVLAGCAKADNVFWVSVGSIVIGLANVAGTFISTGGILPITAGAAIVTGRLIATASGAAVTLAGTAIQLPQPALTVTVQNTCGSSQSFSIADLTPTAGPVPFFTSTMLPGGALTAGSSVAVSVPVGATFTFVSGSTTLALDPSNVAGDRIITFLTVGGACVPQAGSSLTVVNNCVAGAPIVVTADGITTSCTVAAGGTTAIPIPAGVTSITFTFNGETITLNPATTPSVTLAPVGGVCTIMPFATVTTTVTNNCTTAQTVIVSGCGLGPTVVTVPVGGTVTVPTEDGCVNTFNLVGGNTIVTAATSIVIGPNSAGVCAIAAGGAGVGGITLAIVSGCSVATTATVTVVSGGTTSTGTIVIPAGGTVPLTGLLPGDVVTVTANGASATVTIPSTGPIPTIAILGGTCTPAVVSGPSGPAAVVCCPKITVQPIIVKKACPLFGQDQDKRRP